MAVARRHADISGVESLRHAGARPRCDHRRPGAGGGLLCEVMRRGRDVVGRRRWRARPSAPRSPRAAAGSRHAPTQVADATTPRWHAAGTPARRGRGAVALRGSWASPTPGSLNTWPTSRRVRRRPRRSQCGQARCRVKRAASNDPRRPSRPRSKAAARPLPLATTRMRGPASRERTAPAHPLHASRGRRLRRPPSGEAGA